MGARVAILGGGHGLAAVAQCLRDDCCELTAVVATSDDGGSSGELRRHREGPAVGDLRRSLIALTREEVTLARGMARSLTINRVGKHPLGNLMIRSLADALGGLEAASEWLCGQLEVTGKVLPACDEPVTLVGETAGGGAPIHGESAIAAAGATVQRLGFSPARPKVPAAVVEAIGQADWILLAPGSLFTSLLATAALPDVAGALAQTSARVLWIANLALDRETRGMTAGDHLAALRRHRVRVDSVLYDEDAQLRFSADELVREGLEPLPRRLCLDQAPTHEPALLRAALLALFAGS